MESFVEDPTPCLRDDEHEEFKKSGLSLSHRNIARWRALDRVSCHLTANRTVSLAIKNINPGFEKKYLVTITISPAEI
jgi:hypothetical protein